MLLSKRLCARVVVKRNCLGDAGPIQACTSRSVYWHAEGAYEHTIPRSSVVEAVLKLGAVALCIDYGGRGEEGKLADKVKCIECDGESLVFECVHRREQMWCVPSSLKTLDC